MAISLSSNHPCQLNNAFLAKLAWMVATKRDSLCMQILREKYKIKHDWLRFDPPRSASPIWKAIEQAKSIIVKGACYLIGDGSSIDVWQDPWVPWYHGFIPKPRDENSTQLSIKVSHLIYHDLHCWKASIINNLFNSTSAKAILSISIPSRHTPDKLIWVLDLLEKYQPISIGPSLILLYVQVKSPTCTRSLLVQGFSLLYIHML